MFTRENFCQQKILFKIFPHYFLRNNALAKTLTGKDAEYKETK